MRAPVAVVVFFAAVLAAACGGNAPAAAADGTLVLEVGGSHDSLREALRAAGVELAPPRSLRPVAGRAEAEVPAAGEQRPEQASQAEPPPAPIVVPPAAPRYRIVELGSGQTLIHLAKIHLGNGNRFRELLDANGWTEAQARRLQKGTKVKVPIADGGDAGR